MRIAFPLSGMFVVAMAALVVPTQISKSVASFIDSRKHDSGINNRQLIRTNVNYRRANIVTHELAKNVALFETYYSPTNAVFRKHLGFSFHLLPESKNERLLLTLGDKSGDQTAILYLFLKKLGLSVTLPQASSVTYESMPQYNGNSPGFVRDFGVELNAGDVLWRGDLKPYPFQQDYGLNPTYIDRGGDGGQALFDRKSRTLFVTQNEVGLVPHGANGNPVCDTCLVKLVKTGPDDAISTHVIFNPDPAAQPPQFVISRADGVVDQWSRTDMNISQWRSNTKILFEHGVRQIAVLKATLYAGKHKAFYDLDLKMQILPDGTPLEQPESFMSSERRVIVRATKKRPINVTSHFDSRGFDMQTNFAAIPIADNRGRQILIFTAASGALKRQVERRGFKVETLRNIGRVMNDTFRDMKRPPYIKLGDESFGTGGVHCATLFIQQPSYSVVKEIVPSP